MSPVLCLFLDKVVKLVGGGFVMNGATPSNVTAGQIAIKHKILINKTTKLNITSALTFNTNLVCFLMKKYSI